MSGHLFRDRLTTESALDMEVGSQPSIDRLGRSSPRQLTASPRPPSSPSQRQSRSPRPMRDVSLPTNIGDHNPHHRPSLTSQGSKEGDLASPQMMPWPTPPALQDILNSAAAAVNSNKAMRLTQRSQSTTREKELRMKIQILEDTVAEYERQKFNVMGTFAEYRDRVAERERKLEADYSSKIISLTSDVLAAKKAFEERMKEFQCVQLQDKFEREKEAALEKLRQEHHKQMQELEGRCSQSQMTSLEQKYILEIQRLEEERKSLKNEKERLGDTFESKLRRAQSLYETELSASRSLYSTELEALKDHEEALKCELLARQADYRDRIEHVQQQFATSKDELHRCKDEVALLEARLRQKELQVQAISRELAAARTQSNEAMDKLKLTETDLGDARHRLTDAEQSLIQRSNMLSVLESAKTKLEEVIADLQVELKSLKNKVVFLENERQNLESQSDSQVQLTESQVQALKAVLDQVTQEKESTKDHYERQLEQERAKAQEREFALRRELTRQIDELELSYSELRDDFHEKLAEEKAKLAKHQKQMAPGTAGTSTGDDLYNALRVENDSLEEEVQSLRTKLHAALTSEMLTDRQRLTPSHSPRRDSNDSLASESTPPTGDHVGGLRTQLESKDRALQSTSQQVNDLIGKSGSLRRQLEHANNLLTDKASAPPPPLPVKTTENVGARVRRARGPGEGGGVARAGQGGAGLGRRHHQPVGRGAQPRRGRHSGTRRRARAHADDHRDAERTARRVQDGRHARRQGARRVPHCRGRRRGHARGDHGRRRRRRGTRANRPLEEAARGGARANRRQEYRRGGKWEEVDNVLQEVRASVERSLRSTLNEEAAESHVHEQATFDLQLQTLRDEHDQVTQARAKEMETLHGDLQDKDSIIDQLRSKLDGPTGSATAELQTKFAAMRARKDMLKARLAAVEGETVSDSDESGDEYETPSEDQCIDTLTETTSETPSGDTHELVRILADKDEEIERLKAELAKTEGVVVDHQKETHASNAQRRDSSPRVCRKAALMDKWNGIVQQLVAPRGRTTTGSAKGEPRSSSVDVTEQSLSTSTSRGKSRRSSESARTSRSPSRTSTSSLGKNALEKRPAWKF